MSKIVRFYELGGPENLKIEDAGVPDPKEGEVKLHVQAAGLNRAEAMYYRGIYFEKPSLPSKIGYEVVGIVDEVGPDVDPSWKGKRIGTIPGYSMNKYGALAQEAIVPESALAEFPPSLSAIEGAAVWMQYVTAYGALVYVGHVRPEDVVLVTAASSSVGVAAIQIAKVEGAVVIATTRTSTKRNELLELGADAVVATEEEDLPTRVAEVTGGKGARLIFDPISGPFIEKLAASAAFGGTIFEYGMLSLEPTPFPYVASVAKDLSVRGYSLRTYPEMLPDAKKYIYDRLADKRFRPKIAKVFSFEQAADAYRYLESNAQIGKVVIQVD